MDEFTDAAELRAAVDESRPRFTREQIWEKLDRCGDQLAAATGRAEAAEAKLASMLDYRKRRSCFTRDDTPKQAYESEEDAAQHIQQGDWRETYRCFTCSKWHIGKPNYDEIRFRLEATQAQLGRMEARAEAAEEDWQTAEARLARVEAAMALNYMTPTEMRAAVTEALRDRIDAS